MFKTIKYRPIEYYLDYVWKDNYVWKENETMKNYKVNKLLIVKYKDDYFSVENIDFNNYIHDSIYLIKSKNVKNNICKMKSIFYSKDLVSEEHNDPEEIINYLRLNFK